MNHSPTDSRIVDVLAFSRLGGERHGQWPLAAMPRLGASILQPDGPGLADWSARGLQLPVTGGPPEIWLHLQASATVPLQCQRCLQPVSTALAVERRFRFVPTEAEAARLDEVSEDDVLVLEPRLDLAGLLEDELILSLPIVAMHEVCPQPIRAEAPSAGPEIDERPHPFAALAALRKKSTEPER